MSLRPALISALAALLLLPAAAGAVQPGVVQSERYPADEAAQTAALGARWVRLWVDWSRTQPAAPRTPCSGMAGEHADPLEHRVNAYRAHGVNVLVVVMSTPGWANGGADAMVPPSDPQTYADFVACLARRMGDRVAAWEIWNEPDERTFWHGGPQPDRYAALLKATYPKVKAAAPGARVLVGGLVGNNYDFLEQLYRHGAKGNFDAVGVHTDTACLVREPEFYYREPSGRIGRFSFTGYRELRQTMLDHGDDKPVWMTELGWSTLTSECTHPGVSERRPSGVTPDRQADFLRRAYACLAADPYVETALWFSMQDVGGAGTYDRYLGLMDASGRPKPSYEAFRSLFAGAGGPAANPGCGGKVDRDPPSVTLNVPERYFSRLVVEGSAGDPTTPVHHFELWVDGKRVEGANKTGSQYRLDWFGSTKLAAGSHTIELRAYDEAGNMGRATAAVQRLSGSSKIRVAKARVSFRARRAGAGRVRVRARVRGARTGEFTESPRGRLRIFFDRRAGRRWKRYSKFTQGISKPIRFTYKARRPGRWRAWARLAVDAPYRRTRTKAITFRLR